MSRATRELLGPSSCDAACGRQVGRQKVTRVTRPPPLYYPHKLYGFVDIVRITACTRISLLGSTVTYSKCY